jgi:hypothetical protein
MTFASFAFPHLLRHDAGGHYGSLNGFSYLVPRCIVVVSAR